MWALHIALLGFLIITGLIAFCFILNEAHKGVEVLAAAMLIPVSVLATLIIASL